MFPEAIIIGALSFIAGLLFKAYWAKKEEDRWRKFLHQSNDDRYHAIYRWNVTSCHIEAIRRMATQALEEKGGDGGPYRSDPSKLVEALGRIRGKASKNLKEVCREVGCFKSLEEAGRFADGWSGDKYPIITRHEEWDGTCWHVIYGSDVKKTDVDRVLNDIRIGHQVSITEALDAVRSHEMGKKHSHRPLLTDAFKLSGLIANPECMKYTVDQETGVVTIEYEATEEVEPTEIPPPGVRRMST